MVSFVKDQAPLNKRDRKGPVPVGVGVWALVKAAVNGGAKVDEIGNVLRAAFENEEYQHRRQTIAQESAERQQQAFEELQKEAQKRNLPLLRTPTGFAFAPEREGEVIPPDEFNKLPEEERKEAERHAEELQQKTQKIFQKVPKWEREMREKLRELNREVTGFAVGSLIEEAARSIRISRRWSITWNR
jgi:hypothetical protein